MQGAAGRAEESLTGQPEAAIRTARNVESVAHFHAKAKNVPTMPSRISEVSQKSMPSLEHQARVLPIGRIMSMVYLAGCLIFGLQLVGSAIVLRRQLSVCRPVTDAAVLTVLEKACRQIGLRRPPDLRVTPESISPFIVGTLRPRIILPESIVTEAPGAALRHVLAHELAHLVRGDLWTNWLLLAARLIHWFNPVAWWTIREMQAEREAACDDFALAALGEADRSQYASTIIELAASLAPSGMAPAMIGLISSTRRLTTRIERLARPAAVTSLRSPIAASLVLGLVLLGLTDAMPVVEAQSVACEAATRGRSRAGEAGDPGRNGNPARALRGFGRS